MARVIRSATRKKILFKSYEPAKTITKKVRGLMFRKRITRPLLFVFESEGRRRNSIHSFFCFMRFDAIFMDSRKRVVDIKEEIEPFSWKIYVPRRRCKYLIECRAGDASRLGIREGERLSF